MEDFTTNTSQSREPLPGQTPRPPAGQNLGIAALITAIVTFVLSVIPCVGIIAIVPGIIAVVLASIGLSQASRNDSPRGVLVAALIIGVVATMIAFSQIFVAGKIGEKFEKNWGGRSKMSSGMYRKMSLTSLRMPMFQLKLKAATKKWK